MFATDARECAEIAHESVSGFNAVCKLAILSAQAPFASMDKAMRAAETRDWTGVQNVTATKRLGCEWLDDHGADLWTRNREVWRKNPRSTRLEAMLTLMSVPGLGMVKAGFAVQMLLGEVGCLDTHNLARLGLNPSVCNPGGKGTRARIDRAIAYISLCDKLGGAQSLWDAWCVYVAVREPQTWQGASDVSRWHVTCIDGMP